MHEYVQVVTTAEKREDAGRLARAAVEKRLAACAQVVGPITSIYWWEGKISEAEEWLCIMKTTTELYGELEKTLRGLHPYEVPEILAVPVSAGSGDYLEWLRGQLK